MIVRRMRPRRRVAMTLSKQERRPIQSAAGSLIADWPSLPVLCTCTHLRSVLVLYNAVTGTGRYNSNEAHQDVLPLRASAEYRITAGTILSLHLKAIVLYRSLRRMAFLAFYCTRAKLSRWPIVLLVSVKDILEGLFTLQTKRNSIKSL